VVSSPFEGTRIICEARTPTPEAASVSHATLDELVEVLRRRVAGLGLVGASVEQNDKQQIVIELPAANLTNEQVRALTAVTLLEIIDTGGEFLAVGTRVDTSLGPLATPPAADEASPAPHAPTYTTIVSSAELVNAYAITDDLGQLDVEFDMTPAGSARLLAFTSAHIGQPMSVVVDKLVIETATIQAAIGEHGLIAGLSATEVASLAAQLDSGVLPAPLAIISTEIVP
jgi:preprotein translocase subunit SecD